MNLATDSMLWTMVPTYTILMWATKKSKMLLRTNKIQCVLTMKMSICRRSPMSTTVNKGKSNINKVGKSFKSIPMETRCLLS